MVKSVHRRRVFGTACLIIAAAMLLLGQTLLKPYLDGAWFIFYWLGCFLLTGSALMTALLEVQAVRRQARELQHDLLRDALEEPDRDAKK